MVGMQNVLKVVISGVVLLGGILILSQRKGNKLIKSERPVIAHTYYYYPKANFYYDSTKGNYICWDSATTEWKITDKLPVHQVDLGKRVRIGESLEPIWKDNPQHRLIYSVSLYSDPEDFKKKEKAVVADTSQKSDSLSEQEKTEKKSGVKKFFERVFPPKKKKDG